MLALPVVVVEAMEPNLPALAVGGRGNDAIDLSLISTSE